MKKTSAMLAALLMALSLSACGSEQTPDSAAQTEQIPAADTAAQTEQTPAATPEETPASTDAASSEGIRPDFKEAMDSYEAFYQQYCDFMKKYQANPTDVKLLAEYPDMLAKADEMSKAFDAWEQDDLNKEELKYYLDVNNRVMQMLVDVTG